MGNGKGTGKPPGMPKSAPTDLKEFVACKRLTVVIDMAKLDWVPTQGTGFGEIRVESGAKPNTATVVLDGPLGADIELPASVNDGVLELDTSGIPGLFGPIRDRIDGWVKAFNDTMKRNGKRLDGFKIRRGKVTLTKSPVAATDTAVGAAAAVTPAVTPSVTPPVRPVDKPEKPAQQDSGWSWGCVSMLAVFVVLALAVVSVFLLLRGDDKVQTDPSAAIADESQDLVETPAAPEPESDQSEQDAPATAEDPQSGEIGTDAQGEPIADDYVIPEDELNDIPYIGMWSDLVSLLVPENAASSNAQEADAAWISNDPPADAVVCQTDTVGVGQNVDLTGVTGVFADGVLTVSVSTSWTPEIRASDSSTSTVITFPSRTFIVETHAGTDIQGEQNPDGPVTPADITLEDGLVTLKVEVDAPPRTITVQSFNSPTDSDPTSCDFVRAYADPYPTPNAPGRWESALTETDTPHAIVESPSDGMLFACGDDLVLVRVLNACSENDHHWVWIAASPNAEFELSVTDTESGESNQYSSPPGGLPRPIVDSEAFATCP